MLPNLAVKPKSKEMHTLTWQVSNLCTVWLQILYTFAQDRFCQTCKKRSWDLCFDLQRVISPDSKQVQLVHWMLQMLAQYKESLFKQNLAQPWDFDQNRQLAGKKNLTNKVFGHFTFVWPHSWVIHQFDIWLDKECSSNVVNQSKNADWQS